MNNLNLVPEEDVIARRKLLDRTREWADFNNIKAWEPGETHRCDYNTMLKDFGLDPKKTKPRSFVITFRDNLSWLWVNEDYPQMQPQQVKLKSGESVLYITRVADMIPFSEKCPEVEITEMPEAKAKRELLVEAKLVNRAANGTILTIRTDKGKVKKEDVTAAEWSSLLKKLEDKGIPTIRLVEEVKYTVIVDGWELDWDKLTDQQKIVYRAAASNLVLKPSETLMIDTGKRILKDAIAKVKAGEKDVEKIVDEAKADAQKVGIKDIIKLGNDIRDAVKNEMGITT